MATSKAGHRRLAKAQIIILLGFLTSGSLSAGAARVPVVPKTKTVGSQRTNQNQSPIPTPNSGPRALPQPGSSRIVSNTQELSAASAKAVDALLEAIKLQQKANPQKAEQVFNRTMFVIDELPFNTGLKEKLSAAFPDFAARFSPSKALPPEETYVAVLNIHPSNFSMGQAKRLTDASQIEQMLKMGLSASDKSHGPDSENSTDILLELIALYVKQARYSEAAPYCSRMSTTYQKLSPDVQRRLAPFLLDTAGQIEDQNRPQEAAMLYAPVTKICASVSWAGVDDLCQKLVRLATSAKNQNQYDEAESLYKASVALRENSKPEDPLKLAADRRALGTLLESQRKYGAAEELYKMALAGEEKHRGADSVQNLPTLMALSKFYLVRNKQDEAKALLPRIKQMLAKSGDPDGSNQTMRQALELATEFGIAGDGTSCLELFTQCMNSRTNRNYDYEFRNSIEKLSRAYQQAGQPEEAEKLLNLYISVHDSSGSSDSYSLFNMVIELARSYITSGSFDKAVPIVDRAVKLTSDGNLRSYQYRIKEIADLYATKGRLEDAEKLLSRFVGSGPPKMKDELASWLQTSLELSSLYARNKKPAEAQKIYDQVVSSVMESMPADCLPFKADIADLLKQYASATAAPITGNAASDHGAYPSSITHQYVSELVSNLVHRGRTSIVSDYIPRIADRWANFDPDRAERIYKLVLETTKQRNGEEDRHYYNVLSWYVSFLHRTGRSDEAQSLEKRMRALQEQLHKNPN